jgi:hypothetical protein
LARSPQTFRKRQREEKAVILRVQESLRIDDLRKHSTEIVERLRGLLAAGVLAQPDPHRRDFYELEDGCQVFYIHFRPSKRKVLFLAIWNKDCPDMT